MRVEFDGMDYLFTLEENELKELTEHPIRTVVTTSSGETDKAAVLTYGQTKHVAGIEIRYQREGAGFDGVREITVEINQWAYSHISRRGRFSTREGNQVLEIRLSRKPV